MRSKSFSKSQLSIAIKKAIVSSGTALALASTPAVQADEIEDMKLEVQQLILRIDQLESQQAITVEQEAGEKKLVDTGYSTIKPDKRIRNANHQDNSVDPLTFKFGQSNTEVTVSGYVKLDAFMDTSQDVGDSFVFSSILADGNAEADRDPQFRMHARQSRLRVKSKSNVNGTELATHWEGDFYGAGGNQSFSNSTAFRLRHAYVTYGNWLFGQTWSNFMENNFVAYPGTVDFFGPVGQSFVRAPQIRYTADNGFSISIENPETDGTGSVGRLRESTGGIGSDEMPDITLAWRGGPGGAGGSYEFGLVSRDLAIETDTNADGKNDVDENESGFGWMAAGGWQLGPAYLYAHLNGGDGIGRYIINGFANDVFVDGSGNVETVESIGGNFGVTFDTSDDGDYVNITYGFFENDDPDASNGIDELTSLHVGYVNAMQGGLSMGVEVITGDITNADGSEGDNTRLQFMAQKSF